MEHRLASFFVKILNEEYQRTELETAKMIYGLEILLDNLLKVIFIVVLSLVLGIFKESMLVLLGFGILRIKAGGFHFDKNIMCWIVSTLIPIGGGTLISMNFITKEIAILLIFITLVIILLYAPSGTINNPIAPENRKKYYMESVGIVIIYLLTCILGEMQIGRTLAVGGICEAVTILPVVNRKYSR